MQASEIRDGLLIYANGGNVKLQNAITGNAFTLVIEFKPTSKMVKLASPISLFDSRDNYYSVGGKGIAILNGLDQYSFGIGDGTNSKWLTFGYLTKLSTLSIISDGSTIKIYVDGNMSASYDISSYGSIYASEYMYIGKSPLQDSRSYTVYYFMVWNRALSDDEISEVYSYIDGKCSDIPRDGLVLWLDGDSIDEENGIWRDKSPYRNNGTIYGAKKISSVGVISRE